MRVGTLPFQQTALSTGAHEEQRVQRPAVADTPHILAGGPCQAGEITGEVARAAADAANKILGVLGTTVEFTVHEETGFEILQIIDTRTNTVLREMPPHEILDMIARMWEAIGVFVDKTA